ncbi:hypothetical protein MMYC01_204947 [Madurella mycetomatis]|uniref:Uncharacterized protein n=1 Tax=Madurella mycetomatis TaxID=100816 RepID=A0A175W0K4_9PEZI|nr:hypothetical protein MMYC01_204947 [Madurella mycetomatis]
MARKSRKSFPKCVGANVIVHTTPADKSDRSDQNMKDMIISPTCIQDNNAVPPLTRYLDAVGLAHLEAEIYATIVQGAHDVHAIMAQPRSVDDIQRLAARHSSTRARQATAIMWYLTAIAVQRNQHFVTGAYLCSDPDGRLSAFFRGIGTPRLSSHLKRHSVPGCTGGIDLHDSGLPPLPHGHRHVLFIAIANDKRRGNCLFLKPERYGVSGFRNLAHHVVQYAISFKRRRTFGSNEAAGMRKERIPDRLVAAFAEAVASLPDGPSAITEVGRRGEGEGIAGMHDFLVAKLSGSDMLPEPTRKQMRSLLDLLLSEYDFVSLRFGNEVFIDLRAEISRPLTQAAGVHGSSPSLLSSCPNDVEAETGESVLTSD